MGIPVILGLLLSIVGVYLYYTADFLLPDVDVDMSRYELMVNSDSLKSNGNGTLYLNKYGLWEAKLQGTSIDRGAAYGVLSKELLKFQESVFVNEIYKIIPSNSWVEFLHKLIVIFNRNMAKHIPKEYREEIYAMSLSCSDDFNSYGPSYARQLNYHAAHDIGHAMQQYMLVGCSSFATWGEESESGQLLIGRNFDFFVGNDFAKNKVLLFVEPTDGYKFVSVSWPGMMGVLSGMNSKGLTVTINAASGSIPTASAMPISLLARHILQYATTISEAYAIAQQYETFVSESLLIGAAKDGKAAIIEKTPTKMALYQSDTNRIVCTNHYQSEEFMYDEYNKENIRTSDSPYRWNRLNQLIDGLLPINAVDATNILRNRYGMDGKDIGICNEKSLNQFIAHHSVVFQPEELRMWVSTSPWQLGAYVCFDLDDIFGTDSHIGSFAIDSLKIDADSAQMNNEYIRAVKYREDYTKISKAMEDETILEDTFINGFIENNPAYFQVYNVLGDYMMSNGKAESAKAYWKKALSLEIPRLEERDEIKNKVLEYD